MHKTQMTRRSLFKYLSLTGFSGAVGGIIGSKMSHVLMSPEAIKNRVFQFDSLDEAATDRRLKVGDVVNIRQRQGATWDVLSAGAEDVNGYSVIGIDAFEGAVLSLRYGKTIRVREFGLIGDGVADDRHVIRFIFSVLTHGNIIDWEGLTIGLGSVVDNDIDGLFVLDSVDDIAFINPPKFVIKNEMTGGKGVLKFNPVFKFIDCNSLTLKGELTSNAYDVEYPHGPVLFFIESDKRDTERLEFDCGAVRCVSPIMLEQKAGSTHRLSGVVGRVKLKIGTYAYRALQTGDDCEIAIDAQRHARSFYPIGVSNVHARVNSKDNQRVNDVLIKTYTDHVTNITVDINQIDSLSNEWPVVLEQQNDAQGGVSSIKNVTVNLRTNAARSGATPEFFKIAQRDNNQAIKEFTTNEFDEIELNLLGNQVSSKNAKIYIPTAIVGKGVIRTNFADDIPDTKGFTFLKGSDLIVKRRGPYGGSSKKIWLSQINRSVIQAKLIITGVGDYTSTAGYGRYFLEYGLVAYLNDLGGGDVISFNLFNSINESAAPTVSVDFSGFNLNVNTINDANFQHENSEICCTLMLLSSV